MNTDENTLMDYISEIANKINAEKERLLFERCVKRIETDEPINFTHEATKRFPRIKKEYNSVDQSEHWYWNDGTDGGLHLISFYQNNDMNIISEDYKVNFSIKFE